MKEQIVYIYTDRTAVNIKISKYGQIADTRGYFEEHKKIILTKEELIQLLKDAFDAGNLHNWQFSANMASQSINSPYKLVDREEYINLLNIE